MTPTVEEVVARVPIWKDSGDLKISPLGGGITNRNFRVDTGGESFALRIPGENTEMLGINREFEYAANLTAGQHGLGPQVVYFVRPEGCLVTRFVNGRPFPPDEMRLPENIRRVAEILHQIHGLPELPGKFSAFEVVRDYSKIAGRYKVGFPENFDWLSARMTDAEGALTKTNQTLLPCHNDLLNGNFLVNDKIFVLDWEYAGMGDIFFDLANFSNNHELSAEQDRLLLDCYFGDVTSGNLAHLNIMKIMSDFREAMWGLVQIGISDLDFDFREYADKHFRRLTQNIQNPHWNNWIMEVTQRD
jgi:thiamine kinase-like enzyme